MVIVVILKNHFDDGSDVDGNDNQCKALERHDGGVAVQWFVSYTR